MDKITIGLLAAAFAVPAVGQEALEMRRFVTPPALDGDFAEWKNCPESPTAWSILELQ